jgi:hypothetical protein
MERAKMSASKEQIEAAQQALMKCNTYLSTAHMFVALQAAERAAWQPIETAKDGNEGDLWIPQTVLHAATRVADCHVRGGKWMRPNIYGKWIEIKEATHWRPLPVPPKESL